jgi:hypothetical protein
VLDNILIYFYLNLLYNIFENQQKNMPSLKYMSKGWNVFISIAYEMEESCNVDETFKMDLCFGVSYNHEMQCDVNMH